MNHFLLVAAAIFSFSSTALAEGLKYIPVFQGKDFQAKNLGVRSLSHGGNLTGTLIPGDPFALWQVTAKDKGSSGWSMLGIEYPGKCLDQPVGFRLTLEPLQNLNLNMEIRSNTVPGKGFWLSRWIVQKKLSLPAQKQTIQFTWDELKISPKVQNGINAVSIGTNIPCSVRIYEFGLLYDTGKKTSASCTAVPFFHADGEDCNPVARPFDKLSSVYSTPSGGGLSGELTLCRQKNKSLPAWEVRRVNSKAGWAAYGFGFYDPVVPAPDGVRFTVSFSQPTSFGLNLMKSFSKERGFYTAQPMGIEKKFQLPAGKHVLNILCEGFNVPEKDHAKFNAVRFTTFSPTRMTIHSIDLLYRNKAAAEQRMQAIRKNHAAAQKTMIDVLEARQIPWRASLKKLQEPEIEKRLWQGIQFSAQREQLKYYGEIYQPERAHSLLKQVEQSIVSGANGKFTDPDPLQQQINAYIDQTLKALPLEKRYFRYDEKSKLFRSPDGTPFRMFGPHFFRTNYRAEISRWRPWDIRYLSGLGFNGIRLEVRWLFLEPERGKFDVSYLQHLKSIIREAERYGFAVSVDLHWPFPQWVLKGNPAFEKTPPRMGNTNIYLWPDAVVDTWKRLGAELAECPNILAFEVPSNETPFANTPAGLTGSRYLMHRWNDFLKKRYGSREALQKCWSAAADRYALAPDEDWDKDSIRPIGFQNDATPDEAFAANPRIYDHICFAAMMQTELSGRIMQVLRQTRPDAMGIFQRTIGDIWDRSPIPVDYRAIETCVGEHVLPGTHYGLGGISAQKTASISQGGYDSEQQMEGSRPAVEAHVALGLGLCPFAFHHRGGGGMLLCDDEWHLKHEVLYLVRSAAWIRSHSPVKPIAPRVAVISNARLAAAGQENLNPLVRLLEKKHFYVGIFESLRIQKQPELLHGYSAVIVNATGIDLDLITLLRKRFKGKVLFTGRLDFDCYARNQAEGLPGYLVKNQLFLKRFPINFARDMAGKINLAGRWDFFFSGKQNGKPLRPIEKPEKCEKMNVPSLWGEIGLTGSLQYRIGDGWYFKRITIPATWKGRPLSLKLGAIDDVDWTFFNGKQIGHTGENTHNYWLAARNYPIPAEYIQWGKENELVILVRNLRDDGGISRSPAEITGNAAVRFRLVKGSGDLRIFCDEHTPLLRQDQLADNAKILGLLQLENGENYAALLQQGNWYYYASNSFSEEDLSADQAVLKLLLQNS